MESTRLRHISGEMMRSILSRRPYPSSLFTQIIARIRADGQVSGLRAAILKACLVRNKEAISVSLDRESKNPGYRLGRLFAVLDAAQRAGIGKVNAGVREKFMGAASAAPARVFPVLLRNYENHLSSAKKKGRVGRAIRLDKEYAQIIEGISMPFPPLLTSADQGQFFVAFHLQQTDLFKPREKGETISDEDKDEAQAADTIEE
jgi:CRISPR-associated protein Csd1